MSEPKRPRRPTPQDDNCLAEFWAQYADHLEAELTRCKEIAERDGRDYAKLSNELAQLRNERDEALQREAENADKLKHYWLYSLPKLEAKFAELRAERERLLECLGRIRPLAKSIALISEADEDAKDMADSIWTITIAALTQQEGGEDE